MLARWLRYKEEEVKGPKKRRPYLAELCDDLHEAEKWRGTIIKDISRNVAEIQNASLGEHRIRDLNDRINKLFREKRHWERRIRTLGGKDYKFRSRGYGGYGHGAYLYFGAAKDLPGVRELLQKEEKVEGGRRRRHIQLDRVTQKQKRPRSEMLHLINADYYGFGDDDDNELFWREKEMEQKLRRAKVERWRRDNEREWKEMQRRRAEERERERDRGRMTRSSGYIPSQQEIDAIILEKRKQLLMQKYVGQNGDSEAAKSLAQSVQIQEAHRRLMGKDSDGEGENDGKSQDHGQNDNDIQKDNDNDDGKDKRG